jgi:hypothetical protein
MAIEDLGLRGLERMTAPTRDCKNAAQTVSVSGGIPLAQGSKAFTSTDVSDTEKAK